MEGAALRRPPNGSVNSRSSRRPLTRRVEAAPASAIPRRPRGRARPQHRQPRRRAAAPAAAAAEVSAEDATQLHLTAENLEAAAAAADAVGERRRAPEPSHDDDDGYGGGGDSDACSAADDDDDAPLRSVPGTPKVVSVAAFSNYHEPSADVAEASRYGGVVSEAANVAEALAQYLGVAEPPTEAAAAAAAAAERRIMALPPVVEEEEDLQDELRATAG